MTITAFALLPAAQISHPPCSTCASPPSTIPCYFLSRRIVFLSGSVGQVCAVQSGTFSGKAMTLDIPPSTESSSHPPFSVIARAAPGQLFPIALQIEMHYQCRYV